MRGTPHVHSLVCIKHDGIGPDTAECDDVHAVQELKRLIKGTVSARLVDRHQSDFHELPVDGTQQQQQKEEEKKYHWLPHKMYITDKDDPRRQNFDPNLDYERSESGEFNDPIVQTKFRRLQISTQMHDCCFICFKYCIGQDKICRFCFP
jgi:hypothetical protein